MKYFYVLHFKCFASFKEVELYKNFSANVYSSPNSGDACFFAPACMGRLRGLVEEPGDRFA